ncbi:chaplin [Streptomyces sp. NPDC056983]|uniref:chaplin n=1 Tax=Streptomyces sp. NPDC056983 TaxID=3345987 RepID=UPI003625F6C0
MTAWPQRPPGPRTGCTACSRRLHPVVQAPVHIPVNACGDTVNVIGLLNPAFGNSCSNGSGSWAIRSQDKRHMSRRGSMNHGGGMGYDD